MKLYTVLRNVTDPYENLALESYLMQIAEENSCILYLWQNEPTVVIGRNQNVWKECRTSLLQEDGIHLARRLSGGGAVYHDLGNLNFTFVAKEPCYDQQKQFAVVQNACSRLDIQVNKSGRNDLVVNGFKFSGNAFLHQGGVGCHHGTLLIDSDFSKLSDYLTPSKAKLQAKGVSSVRSRVTNLKSLCPDLTVEKMRQAFIDAFEEVYQANATPLTLSADANSILKEKSAQLSDPQWLFGTKQAMTCSMEERFDWGCITIELMVENGIIGATQVFTDSLDWTLSEKLEKALTGCAFQKSHMLKAIESIVEEGILKDISSMMNI